MMKAITHLVFTVLLLAAFCLCLPAFGLTYEIYTLQTGDTKENLAWRLGITPENIVSLDNAPWQEGKKVAICGVSAPPSTTPSSTASRINESGVAWQAKVILPDCDIRSDKGDFLFRPEVGSVIAVVTETQTHYGLIMADRSTGWIEKSAVKIEASLPKNWMEKVNSGDGQLVSEAFRYLGLPYRYGGRLPYDIDCSLLVQTVFRSRGINLPRTAAAQSQVGMSVSLSEAIAGDRLYFVNSRGQIGHAGIYIGEGRFIHASSRRGCVAVDDLAGSYLRTLAYIRR